MYHEASHNKILRTGHRMHLCVFSDSQNKRRLFLYSVSTRRFLCNLELCLLRGKNWIFKYNSGYMIKVSLPTNAQSNVFFLLCYMFRLRILAIVTGAQSHKDMSSVLQVGKYLRLADALTIRFLCLRNIVVPWWWQKYVAEKFSSVKNMSCAVVGKCMLYVEDNCSEYV